MTTLTCSKYVKKPNTLQNDPKNDKDVFQRKGCKKRMRPSDYNKVRQRHHARIRPVLEATSKDGCILETGWPKVNKLTLHIYFPRTPLCLFLF